MYEKFFSLAHRPFAAAPNLECIVSHQGYLDAREKLMRCLTDGCGTAILTAQAGLGKSVLCQDLQSRLRGLFTVAYLCSAQFPNRKAMLQAILFELSAEYLGLSEDEARLGILKAAQEAAERGRSLIVIVDEAHLVSTELLQELRALAEPSPRCATPVRLMLSGQLELEERLADHSLDSLNQRVACHAILEPLTQAESAEYILERLAIAGAKTQTFTEEALAFVVKAADGNPRAIHQLCDHCLLSAYTIEERPISLEIARNSLDDLRALPLHWNDTGLLDDSPDSLDDALDEASDDEFVATDSSSVHGGFGDQGAAETEEAAVSVDPGPLWSDSPNYASIEVGGAFEFGAEIEPEAESVPEPTAEVTEAPSQVGTDSEPELSPESIPPFSEAALFASIAPWPAVPVESIGTAFRDAAVSRFAEAESVPVEDASAEMETAKSTAPLQAAAEALTEAMTDETIEATVEAEEPAAASDSNDDDTGFTVWTPDEASQELEERDECEEDTAIEKGWSHQIDLLDELEADDFEDEEIIINDHYAALDRASQALSNYLPQAPELLQFLSQYSVKDERHDRVASPMHQSAVEVVEPAVDTIEEELLETIRGLQEQLQRASVERPRPHEPWEESLDSAYDVVEPPEEIDVPPLPPVPVVEEQIVLSSAPVPAPVETPVDVRIDPPAEPARSRFAQLFSRMRQRRREVEDRLRKNADWI